MRSGPRCDLQEVAVGNQIWLARYSPGVMPMTSRKAREKFDCEENPVDRAMSAVGLSAPSWRMSEGAPKAPAVAPRGLFVSGHLAY